MPTTVTKTIGSGGGRDYSTIDSWADASPANLVTDDKIWKGEAYNDAAFNEVVTVSGITTDSTRYVWLTAAAGQSFRDNANIRTTALDYGGVSDGVELWAGSYAIPFTDGVGNTVVERFQIKNDVYFIQSSGTFKNCKIKGLVLANGFYLNCFIKLSTTGDASNGWGGGRIEYCTFIATGGASLGNAAFSPLTVENTAFFGFSSYWTTSYGGSLVGGHNCTDLASAPGSSNQVSKTFANQFISTTNDFRAKSSGSDLENNGTPATSYATDDISGTSRSATTPTIGAWELVAAGGGAAAQNLLTLLGCGI